MDLQTAQAIIAAHVGKDAKDDSDRQLAEAIGFLICSTVAGVHHAGAQLKRIADALDRFMPAESAIIGVPRQ